jgi:predicted negative regulator of RcsB-dependent stress response
VLGRTAVQPWQVRHPGGSLSVAIVLLPLMLWFGWRLWQELAGDAAREQRTETAPRQQATSAPI